MTTAGDAARITNPCWDEMPGDVLHCTEPPGHECDHYHWPTKTEWPNKPAGEAAPEN